MTRDRSMEEAGKMLASVSEVFSLLKEVLPETGVELDSFLEFARKSKSETISALNALIKNYHLNRLIKKNFLQQRNSIQVREDLVPPTPRAHSFILKPCEGRVENRYDQKDFVQKKWSTVSNIDGTLFVNDKPVELFKTPRYETDDNFTLADIVTDVSNAGKTPITASILFALMHFQHLIPESWSVIENDPRSPLIVFLGTRWHIDHWNGYQYLEKISQEYSSWSVDEKSSVFDRKFFHLTRWPNRTVLIPVV